MRFVLDMNVRTEWVEGLRAAGLEVVHWSEVDDIRATDSSILAWAKEHGYSIITRDLDFPQILAITQAAGPSVIVLRTPGSRPGPYVAQVAAAITRLMPYLEDGAIVSIDSFRHRVRLLPLGPR